MTCIRELRKNAGLTQVQLAEKLGVTQSAIAQWESGRAQPGIHHLLTMSRLFDRHIEDLICNQL